MSAVVADTHTVLWYLSADPRFSVWAREAMEQATDEGDPDSAFQPISLTVEIAFALREIPRSSVPDLPDRVIAATALSLGPPLVTCGRKMQASGIEP